MKNNFLVLLLCFSNNSHSQLIVDSVLIENHYRSFSYNLPATDITGGSLMFVMHGSGGTGSDMYKKTTALETIASPEKLLIVYPNGYQRYWNECRKFSTAAANKEDINEVAFFESMITYFITKYGINNIFASGFSGGGHMAYKLALTMPGKIKAIAAIVANLPDSASCDCVLTTKPLPVLIINGTLDNTNPYLGGEMFVNNTSFGVVRSTEKTFNFWSTMAGYTGNAKMKKLPDTDTTDQKLIESYTFKKHHKPTVSLLKVIGGKHDYPNDIDVYIYTWKFFKSSK